MTLAEQSTELRLGERMKAKAREEMQRFRREKIMDHPKQSRGRKGVVKYSTTAIRWAALVVLRDHPGGIALGAAESEAERAGILHPAATPGKWRAQMRWLQSGGYVASITGKSSHPRFCRWVIMDSGRALIGKLEAEMKNGG